MTACVGPSGLRGLRKSADCISNTRGNVGNVFVLVEFVPRQHQDALQAPPCAGEFFDVVADAAAVLAAGEWTLARSEGLPFGEHSALECWLLDVTRGAVDTLFLQDPPELVRTAGND